MTVSDLAHFLMMVQNQEIAFAFFFLGGGEDASSHLIRGHNRLDRIGMLEDPQKIIDRLSILIKGTIPQALDNYRLDK